MKFRAAPLVAILAAALAPHAARASAVERLSLIRFTRQERTRLRQAEGDSRITGKNVSAFLSRPLTEKRARVLELERQGIGEAFEAATKARSEGVLDERLRLLSQAVAATGIDGLPSRSLHRIIALVDGESLEPSSRHAFGIAESFQRTQGVATDGNSYWFSSKNGLLRAGSESGPTLMLAENAIPEKLRAEGCDHIGDIDLADGELLAPFEDGGVFSHLFLARFDAKTLSYKGAVRVPNRYQRDGLPWIAFDADSRRVFTSEFGRELGPTTRLNAYEWPSMKPLPPVLLSRPIGSVQGAKISRGMMYLTSDGDRKLIYKVNLRTGTVMPVALLGDDVYELEGLALAGSGAGRRIDVLALARDPGPTLRNLLTVRMTDLAFRVASESRRDRFLRTIPPGR